MLGFQGGVSIPLVKGGVKAPPAKRQCRAGPKAGARRGFTYAQCTRHIHKARFADLYSDTVQLAERPWRLAFVTIMQCAGT
jgi:hypothetical protein